MTDTQPTYTCSYCDGDYTSVSAMIACEIGDARDRGRE